MCLAVPGRIEQIYESDGLRMAKVNFGGIKRSTCIEYTPQAKLDSYVLVHVGFAISVIDEEEAQRTFNILQGADELKELANYTEAIDEDR